MPDKKIKMLSDVGLKISVELGRVEKAFKEILAMEPGTVIELNTSTGDRIDFLVNDKLVAKGEVLVVDGKMALRVTNIVGSLPRAVQEALDKEAARLS